jgi:hypothetical protein
MDEAEFHLVYLSDSLELHSVQFDFSSSSITMGNPALKKSAKNLEVRNKSWRGSLFCLSIVGGGLTSRQVS